MSRWSPFPDPDLFWPEKCPWIPPALDRDVVARSLGGLRRAFSRPVIARIQGDGASVLHPLEFDALWIGSSLELLDIGLALDELPRVREQRVTPRRRDRYASTRAELWTGLLLHRSGAA